jgi:hypothetical protein
MKLEDRLSLLELEIETLKRLIKVNAAEINKQRPQHDGKPEGETK